MLRAKSLANCDITVSLNAQIEQATPEQCMKGGSKEEIAGFTKAVEAVKKCGERASKLWGWCQIEVTVTVTKFPTISHTSYLGACSYKSRQDFIDNSSYYDDMVGKSMIRCQKLLNAEADKINDSGLFEDVFNPRYQGV